MIYGRLDTLTGGYLYDRQMVAALEARGHRVRVISLPVLSYPGQLALNGRLTNDTRGLDLLLQDELCHPSLIRFNTRRTNNHSPAVAVVHQVLCDEPRATWRNRLLRLVEKRYLDRVDGFVFNSYSTRDTVWRLTAADRPHVVAPPGGDRLGAPLSSAAIRARAREPAPLRLLFLGNLIPRKGLLPLIHALAGLPHPPWELRVVGRLDMNAAYVRRVRYKLAARGLAGRVQLVGRREGASLAAELKRAQLLCMPYAYEGFGMATLEAQAFGLPVIGAREGATGELISDGVNGYLVRRGDHAAVCRVLAALDADRTKLAQMGLSARRRFGRHPTWAGTMERLAVFLETLAASRRPRRRPFSAGLKAVSP
jgi:glycosyltransferase involved in cell wall biosynthesis